MFQTKLSYGQNFRHRYFFMSFKHSKKACRFNERGLPLQVKCLEHLSQRNKLFRTSTFVKFSKFRDWFAFHLMDLTNLQKILMDFFPDFFQFQFRRHLQVKLPKFLSLKVNYLYYPSTPNSTLINRRLLKGLLHHHLKKLYSTDLTVD